MKILNYNIPITNIDKWDKEENAINSLYLSDKKTFYETIYSVNHENIVGRSSLYLRYTIHNKLKKTIDDVVKEGIEIKWEDIDLFKFENENFKL